MRRFTRLTNAFSKKLDNHIHAIALYFVFYNFCRIHKSLRVSPAMAAGVSDRLWSLEDVVAKIDEMAPQPKPRGPYRKRALALSSRWNLVVEPEGCHYPTLNGLANAGQRIILSLARRVATGQFGTVAR